MNENCSVLDGRISNSVTRASPVVLSLAWLLLLLALMRRCSRDEDAKVICWQ